MLRSLDSQLVAAAVNEIKKYLNKYLFIQRVMFKCGNQQNIIYFIAACGKCEKNNVSLNMLRH